MSCASFLRKIGLLPPKQATDEDIARAVTENALRENEKAFTEMHQAYNKVPVTNEKLRRVIKNSTTPFADLEKIMHGEKRTKY